jgi:Holliday junction resolvase RusA-like endonuclease
LDAPRARKDERSNMIEFTVFGHPEPQGSTRAFIPKGWKRPIITTANPKMKPWRQQISGAAFDLVGDVLEGPVSLTLQFFLAKPPSAPKKRWAPEVKPDLDKLVRAVEDALTGILYKDDAQIVQVSATKAYGLPERVEIKLEPLSLTTDNSAVPKAVIPPLSKPTETVLELFDKSGV